MRFIEINGFSIRPDKQTEFQQWVIANEARIKLAYPQGSEFGGIYGVIYSSDKSGGECYWLETHDSYGALDLSAAVSKDPTSEMAKVVKEFVAFLDPDRNAGWSHHLLKSVVDATVFDMPAS
jgi:hypothetical protein